MKLFSTFSIEKRIVGRLGVTYLAPLWYHVTFTLTHPSHTHFRLKELLTTTRKCV
jgi:hypothetical protein